MEKWIWITGLLIIIGQNLAYGFDYDLKCETSPTICDDIEVPARINYVNGTFWKGCICRELQCACSREYMPVCDQYGFEHSNPCVMCAHFGMNKENG
ncbi:unnamed protein product [Clavelina lepadiformis]|uniref:Kazal-like domain-containing protein n=1 Tax=Clavelina lepadiformis TaxID=159417 RepID=A0ABP0GJZ2_CLALP